MSASYYLTAMFDNCVPRWQLGSCSVTRPFLSLRRVWLARLSKCNKFQFLSPEQFRSFVLRSTNFFSSLSNPIPSIHAWFCSSEQTNCSGQTDVDYHALPPSLASLPYVGQVNHVPLPPELLQEFESILTDMLQAHPRSFLDSLDSGLCQWNFYCGASM